MSLRVTIQTAATPADHAEIARLAHVIWHEHYTPMIGRAQVDYMLAQGYTPAALAAEQTAGSRFLLAYSNAEAIGYAGWTPDTGERGLAWLDKFYVRREARCRGVGTALVTRVIADAGRPTTKLRVNRHNNQAVAAYRQLGFDIETTDIKPIGNGFVMDDYIMRRDEKRLRDGADQPDG